MDCSREAVTRRRQEREQVLQQELSRVAELLKARPDVHLVMLFGSLAAGTCGQHSDLDLVVVLDTDRPFLDRVEELLRCIQPRVDVDLLAYTPGEWERLRHDSAFVRRLAAKGRVIHAAIS